MRVPRPGHLACGATKNWREGARVLSHRWPVTRLPWGPGAEENFRGDHRPGGPHIELPEHADWAIKARFNLFRGNSRDGGFVIVPCVASRPSVWPVSIQRIDLHGPLISYVTLGFDSNVLDSGDILRCVQFIYRVRSENSFSFSLSRSSYRSRNFRVFFLSRPSPRTEWYSFEISMGDCYRIPALVQVCLRFTAWNEQQIAQRSDFYSNEQRTARTAMAKHARDLPRDNLLVNQNDAWRYKVTRQRTRLTINFNTRHHQISRRWLSTLAPHWRWSVSIGIGYRTTNAPFTNDDHPWRSRSTDLSRSLRIIILLLILHTWSYPIIAWFPQFSRHKLKVSNWNCESIIEKDACKTETATFTGIKAKGAAVNVKHWQKGRGGTKEKNETAERAR